MIPYQEIVINVCSKWLGLNTNNDLVDIEYAALTGNGEVGVLGGVEDATKRSALMRDDCVSRNDLAISATRVRPVPGSRVENARLGAHASVFVEDIVS